MRRRGLYALAPLAAVLALLVAGCGNTSETVSPLPQTVEGKLDVKAPAAGDPVAGKQVFADGGCAACHALADAGATGTVGANLDETKPALDLVLDRVKNGKGAMPSFKGQLSDKQIADVAAYVVQATGG